MIPEPLEGAYRVKVAEDVVYANDDYDEARTFYRSQVRENRKKVVVLLSDIGVIMRHSPHPTHNNLRAYSTVR